MSRVIKCDSCGLIIQESNLSTGYHNVFVDHKHECHLCDSCTATRLGDIFPELVPEIIDDNDEIIEEEVIEGDGV